MVVIDIELQSIAITPNAATIVNGTHQQFSAVGTYSDSSTLDISADVTWSSANSGIVNLNSSGNGAAAGVGSTTITATLGDISGSTSVTVSAATLQSITVTPATPSIAMGSDQEFTATGTYDNSIAVDVHKSSGCFC